MEVRTRQRIPKPPAVALDADEQKVQAFDNRIDREFAAMTEHLSSNEKLTLMLLAGEMNEPGYLADVVLNAKPASGQGEIYWRRLGLQS